jgi:tellurite resistance protein TehA-like permease
VEELDLHDPFTRSVIQSVMVTVALIFPMEYGIERAFSGLGRPLFLPIAASLFCGVLGFLIETKQKHYIFALLAMISSVILFPLLAWILLISLHIPYQTREADFVALLPQGFLGIALFNFIRKRYERFS